jgi:hypothetical protein
MRLGCPTGQMKLRYFKFIASAVAVAAFALSAIASASGFPVSHASGHTVQPQRPAGSCHVHGGYPYPGADPRCTPGALNPAVTQATIGATICRSGYSESVRPSTSVTDPEKLASMLAYGVGTNTSGFEYDHLISLELGGAPNDPRNLWPEPGASPNLKDKVENYLHYQVCEHGMTLAAAQRIVARSWVAFYKKHYGSAPATGPNPQPTHTGPSRPAGSDEGVVHPGAFCSPRGATGRTDAGTPMVCGPASDGRDRWHSSS